MVIYRGEISGRGGCQPSPTPPPHLLSLYFLAHLQPPQVFFSLSPPLPLCPLPTPRDPLSPPADNSYGALEAPSAAVRTVLDAAKSALLFSTFLPPLACCRAPQAPAPVTLSRLPWPPPLRVGGPKLSGVPASAGLCPRCWSAYLIHHVHVCQQQHQQCRGRKVPASKGGRGARRGRRALVGTAQSAAAPPLTPCLSFAQAPAHHGTPFPQLACGHSILEAGVGKSFRKHR